MLKMTNVAGIITGAVQGKISQASMQKIGCIIPPMDICQQFAETLNVYFKKIRTTRQESQRLAELRDTLLPKLMKGEIAL